MKKIIALILIVGTLLAFASCKKNNDDNTPPAATTDHSELTAIQSAVDASAPGIADITVTHTSDLGTLTAKYNVVYNKDGSAVVTYTYQQFNAFDPENPAEDIIYTSPEYVAYIDMDGTVYDDHGNEDALEAVFFEFKLDPSLIAEYTVDAGVLMAKIKSVHTAAVIGTDVGRDVALTIVTGTNGITSMSISYTGLEGDVKISTVYSYPVYEEETPEDGEVDLEGEEDGETEEA